MNNNYVNGNSNQNPPIIIGVMGMTGSGKSTFIKSITNDPNIQIGTSLQSCTREIVPSTIKIDGVEVQLVDTPGFDDTDRDDVDILEDIAAWLGPQAQYQVKLAGLIYLHRITEPRMGGNAKRNLSMMKSLVGSDNMQNVVLVTTRWEELPNKAEGEKRQNELKDPNGFWSEMIQQRARIARHNGTPESALGIVRGIMKVAPVYLQMQKELRQGFSVKDTSAGKDLLAHLERQISQLNAKLQTMENQIRQSNQENEHLRQRYEEFSQQVRAKEQSQSKMKQGSMDRIMARVAEYEKRCARKSHCILM